jgi:site-specific DNA recombinase
MNAQLAAEPGVVVIDLYCRISKDYDGTLRSVEDQEALGRMWVADRAELGYVVGKVFRDHALSGWNPKVNRPDFNELMVRLETGVSQGIWVRNLDRFTRKMGEAVRLADAAKAGAIVGHVDGSYDLTTATGLGAFYEDAKNAELESKRISDRTKRGKKMKATQRGRSNASWRGFARPGYAPKPEGWVPGDPREQVDPLLLAKEREALREAVKGLLDGSETLSGIAARWNQAELLTVTGKRWSNPDIRQLLSAPSLAGLLEHKGQIVGELPGEPAIDRASWDRLQLLFKSKKRGRPATSYLGSAILVCGRCGGPMYGRPQASRPAYPDGETRRQYWCQPREKEQTGCGRLVIDWRFADKLLEKLTVKRLADPRHQDRMRRTRALMEAAQKEAVAELNRLEEEADELASKAGTPGWTPARLMTVMGQYGELIAEAQAKVEAVGVIPDDNPVEEAQAEWDAATLVERRGLVRRAFPQGLAVMPSTSSGVAALNDNRIVPIVK